MVAGDFLREGNRILTNYDYVDIAEGTGIQKFYIARPTGSYILTSNQIYASTIESTHTSASTTLTKYATENFDLSAFNLPQTIKGTGIVELGVYWISSSGAGSAAVKLIVNIIHYDGTTETIIGTCTPLDYAGDLGGETTYSATVDITKQHFKKGEILRVEVEYWLKAHDANTKTISVGTDPQNRDGTNITPSTTNAITKSAVYIPFNLDL